MYVIVKGLDGKFHCSGRLQDSTERWTEATLEDAIKSMIDFAKYMNHTKLQKKGIEFLQEQIITSVGCVSWKP